MKRTLNKTVLVIVVASTALMTQAQEATSEDYTLSMAGALINDWCGRQWQAEGYITIHACNFQLAQQYNLAVASAQFNECASLSGGDIVQIADCMVSRFNSWVTDNLQ